MRGDILGQRFLLAAKPAADARLDHANSLGRQTEYRRENPARVERYLRRSANDEAVIFVPIRHDNMWLDAHLLHLRDDVLVFENPVCLFESFLDVANFDFYVCANVSRRVGFCEIDVLRFVVNARRLRFHRVARIENRGQFFVFDRDQL